MRGSQDTDHDPQVRTLRTSMDSAERRCADLPEVQVRALGRAEATQITGPPGAQTPDDPSPVNAV